MLMLNRLGGIELANAYSCIKAIGKKKREIIAKFREQFVAGAQAAGLKKKEAEELFGLIEKFAGYGFNKSHSTAYALIAYMTAYLKAHWPVEFMAALLSSDMPNRNFTRKDSTVEHLEDCTRMKIEVVPPDVNRSEPEFAVAEGRIVFGLAAVKGCGHSAAQAISAARAAAGPFRSLFDFCERVDPGTVNRSTIETLIKAGALDSLPGSPRRAQLFGAVDRALQSGAAKAADRRSGQMGMFDDLDDDEDDPAAVNLPDVPEWEERDKLAKEKEVLGFYLSSHPLAEFESTLSTYCSHTTVEAAALSDRTGNVALGGMLSAVKFSHTKNARPGSPTRYAMFDLEDMAGTMRCIVWPDQFVQYAERVQPDAVVVALGTIDKRGGGDEANLIVNQLLTPDEAKSRFTRGIAIRVSEKAHGEEALDKLQEILRGYPGPCEVQLVVFLGDGTRVGLACERPTVTIDDEMRRRVDDLLGPGNFRLLANSPRPTPARPNGRSGARPRPR